MLSQNVKMLVTDRNYTVKIAHQNIDKDILYIILKSLYHHTYTIFIYD